MKVMLIGVGGYLGGEIFVELMAAGHDVWTVSRRAAGGAELPAGHHVVHDMRQPLTLDQQDFDLVIHAAGANDVQSRDPSAALDMTVLTARHAAEFASRQRRPRLLYLSTFQVYGRDEGPVDESVACQPRNDYASTHLFAEQWIEQFGRTHGLSWIHVRPANIAGVPRRGGMQRWTLAPGCFCQDALRERRIVVRSTGRQYRDFLPLSDVARQVVAAGGAFERFAGGALNICAGAALTIAQVAQLAAERYEARFGKRCEVVFMPPAGAADAAPPQQLQLDSRLFAEQPHERLDARAATARMQACIDDTYQLLARTV